MPAGGTRGEGIGMGNRDERGYARLYTRVYIYMCGVCFLRGISPSLKGISDVCSCPCGILLPQTVFGVVQRFSNDRVNVACSRFAILNFAALNKSDQITSSKLKINVRKFKKSSGCSFYTARNQISKVDKKLLTK